MLLMPALRLQSASSGIVVYLSRWVSGTLATARRDSCPQTGASTPSLASTTTSLTTALRKKQDSEIHVGRKLRYNCTYWVGKVVCSEANKWDGEFSTTLYTRKAVQVINQPNTSDPLLSYLDSGASHEYPATPLPTPLQVPTRAKLLKVR